MFVYGVWASCGDRTSTLMCREKSDELSKKGTHSVGVASQYASALGKTANCQTLVSLTLARGEVPVMVALRQFLPENWTSDRIVPRSRTIAPRASAPAVEGARSPNPTMASETPMH